MQTYEDDCLEIELPEGWCFAREGWHYQVVFTKDRFIVFQLWHDEFFGAKEQYENWKLQFTFVPSDLPGYKPSKRPNTTMTDPFVCGQFSGFCADAAPDNAQPYAHCRMVFLLDDANLSVDAYGLTPHEHEQLLSTIRTLRLKDDYLSANEQLAMRSQSMSQKTKAFDATDLSKPRTKKLKTWMDHQMALLMDSESYPEDNPFVGEGEIDLVMPCNEKALWVTSLTEFDVTLEFVVRATIPKPRKRWWDREAEATLSIPTGKLHIEQTTGGLLMAINLQPGGYRVIVRGSSPPGADAMDDGVEKIQVTLVPE